VEHGADDSIQYIFTVQQCPDKIEKMAENAAPSTVVKRNPHFFIALRSIQFGCRFSLSIAFKSGQ